MNTDKNLIINKFNIETLPTIKELALFQSAFKNCLTIAFKSDGLYFYNLNTNYHVKLSNQSFTQDTLVSLSLIAMTKIIQLVTILNNQDWQIELFNNDTDVKAFRITSEKFTANVFHAGSEVALYPNFEIINKIKPLYTFNTEQLTQLKAIYQPSNIRYQTLTNSFNFTENSVFTVGYGLKKSIPFNTPKELINKSIQHDRVMFLINNKNCNQIDIKIREDQILFNDWQMFDSNIDSVDLDKYNNFTNNDNQYFKILETPKTKKALLPFYNMIKSINDIDIDLLIKDNKITIQKRTIDGFFTYSTDIETNIKECSITINKSCLLELFKKQNTKAFIYKITNYTKLKIVLYSIIDNVEYHAICEEYDHTEEIRIKTQQSIKIMKTCINTMYKNFIDESIKKQVPHIKIQGQAHNNFITGFTVAEFVPCREMIVFMNRDRFHIYDSFTKMTLLDSKEQAENFARECSSLTDKKQYTIIEIKNNAIIYHYEYKTKTGLNKKYELATMLQGTQYNNRMYPLDIENNLKMFLSKKSNVVNRSFSKYTRELLTDISTDIEAYKQAIQSLKEYPYKHKDIIEIDNMIYKYSKTEYKLYCKNNTEQKTKPTPKEIVMEKNNTGTTPPIKEDINTYEVLKDIKDTYKPTILRMKELVNTILQYEYEGRLDTLTQDLEKTEFKGLSLETLQALLPCENIKELVLKLYTDKTPIELADSMPDELVEIVTSQEPTTQAEVVELINPCDPIEIVERMPNELVNLIDNNTQNDPRFIIKLFTDRQKSKVLSPEVFKIDTIEGDFIISNGYKYSVHNIGKVKFSKKGKGSASINLTLDHKPTMNELKDLSDQFISKIK